MHTEVCTHEQDISKLGTGAPRYSYREAASMDTGPKTWIVLGNRGDRKADRDTQQGRYQVNSSWTL